METGREIPPWADAPRFDYRLFKDKVKMARSYRSFTVNLRRFLVSKADEESGGTKYVREQKIPGADGFVHEIPQLPTASGYFIVVMYPPPDMEDGEFYGGGRGVELLFSINNLYYLGFEFEGSWRVFKDASLVGISEKPEAAYKIDRLSIKGSYQGIGLDYEELIIGFNGQVETYRALVNPRWASGSQLVRASCRNVVSISESMRFPFLLKLHLTIFQMGYVDATMDVPVKEDEQYRNPSEHVNDWSNYSGKCREGKQKFAAEVKKQAIPGIPTFECLLNFVALLSNKEHKKLPKHKNSAKQKKQLTVYQDGDKKTGDKKDPQNEKDGKEERKKNNSSSTWFFESPVMPYRSIGRSACVTQETKVYVQRKDKSPGLLGPVTKRRWSFACSKQLIERLIFSEGAGNDLELAIVRTFNWTGPMIHFIPGLDGPSEGVPQNFCCREPLKLVDGVEPQRIFLCVKDAIGAVLLMIACRNENPAQANSHINYDENPNNDVSIGELAEIMIEILAAICMPADDNTWLLDTICRNFIDTLPVIKYCWENNKRLIYFSTCEVWGKTIGTFLSKDRSLCKTIILAAICMPAYYNTWALDSICRNFIDTLPLVKYCWENKRLVYFSTCEVWGKTIGSFLPKDRSLCKVYASVSGEPPLEEPLIDSSAQQFYGKGHGISGLNLEAPLKDLLETALTYQHKTDKEATAKLHCLTRFGCASRAILPQMSGAILVEHM